MVAPNKAELATTTALFPVRTASTTMTTNPAIDRRAARPCVTAFAVSSLRL